jgi:hypothetical protein
MKWIKYAKTRKQCLDLKEKFTSFERRRESDDGRDEVSKPSPPLAVSTTGCSPQSMGSAARSCLPRSPSMDLQDAPALLLGPFQVSSHVARDGASTDWRPGFLSFFFMLLFRLERFLWDRRKPVSPTSKSATAVPSCTRRHRLSRVPAYSKLIGAAGRVR